MKIKHILGFIWCLSLSILFWILAILLLATRQIEKFKVHKDLTFLWDLKNNGWFCKTFLGERGWGGFSCGNNIVVVDSDKERYGRTIRHEREHCYQQYKWGILFPFLYIMHSIIIYVFYPGLHSYIDNKYEISARIAAGQQVYILREQWTNGPTDRWIWW